MGTGFMWVIFRRYVSIFAVLSRFVTIGIEGKRC
jgi:hypothetical protein